MQYHIGRVVKVIGNDKEIISANHTVQAITEMWDKNQLILSVEPTIAPQIKEKDVVIVDYNPLEGVSPPIPKQSIVKILKGKEGKDCWDLFQKYQSDRIKRENPREQNEVPLQGIPYSR